MTEDIILQYFRLSGDISPNPGPKSTRICADCGRAVAQNHRATRCDGCSSWTHIECGGALPKEYHHMKSTGNFSRTCRSCLVLLQQLPFANSSLNSSSNSEPESITEEQNITSMWTEFDNIAQNYCLNFKLGHVNANSIGGFKCYKVKTWLLSDRFDILVISETKIILDGSFPDSQFQVEGFAFRSDRKASRGELMIYVRSDIHFIKVKYLKGITPEEWAAFRTETIILKVKLGRGWIAVVGICRPPSILKHQWTRERSSIFKEVSTERLFSMLEISTPIR